MEPTKNDPGHAPLAVHEAQLTATLVAVAIFVTFVSFATLATVPIAILAWVAVGVAMLMRPGYKRRQHRHQH